MMRGAPSLATANFPERYRVEVSGGDTLATKPPASCVDIRLTALQDRLARLRSCDHDSSSPSTPNQPFHFQTSQNFSYDDSDSPSTMPSQLFDPVALNLERDLASANPEREEWMHSPKLVEETVADTRFSAQQGLANFRQVHFAKLQNDVRMMEQSLEEMRLKAAPQNLSTIRIVDAIAESVAQGFERFRQGEFKMFREEFIQQWESQRALEETQEAQMWEARQLSEKFDLLREEAQAEFSCACLTATSHEELSLRPVMSAVQMDFEAERMYIANALEETAEEACQHFCTSLEAQKERWKCTSLALEEAQESQRWETRQLREEFDVFKKNAQTELPVIKDVPNDFETEHTQTSKVLEEAIQAVCQQFQKSLNTQDAKWMCTIQASVEAQEAQRREAKKLREDFNIFRENAQTEFSQACDGLNNLQAQLSRVCCCLGDVVCAEPQGACKLQKERLEHGQSNNVTEEFNKLQVFVKTIEARMQCVEMKIAELSVGTGDNSESSQNVEVILERLHAHGKGQKSTIHAVDELRNDLEAANEWRMGMVETLNGEDESRVILNEKFQKLNESHDQLSHRAQEAVERARASTTPPSPTPFIAHALSTLPDLTLTQGPP